jgi:hypothetical protein
VHIRCLAEIVIFHQSHNNFYSKLETEFQTHHANIMVDDTEWMVFTDDDDDNDGVNNDWPKWCMSSFCAVKIDGGN